MGFLFFPQAVAAGASNGVKAGVYIPIQDLRGVKAGDLAVDVADSFKESKVLESVCFMLYAAISKDGSGLLGFESDLTCTSERDGLDLFESRFCFTVQYLSNIKDRTVSQIPLPTKGSNVKSNKQSIKEIFPNAQVVADDDAVDGAGIIIEASMFSGFKDVDVTGLNTADDRGYIATLIHSLPDFAMLRDESIESAIIYTRRIDDLNSFLDESENATDSVNPTTSLHTDDLPFVVPISLVTIISIEYSLNWSTGRFSVNVA